MGWNSSFGAISRARAPPTYMRSIEWLRPMLAFCLALFLAGPALAQPVVLGDGEVIDVFANPAKELDPVIASANKARSATVRAIGPVCE